MAANTKEQLTIAESIRLLNFSRKSDIKQLLIDWPRWKKILFIESEELTSYNDDGGDEVTRETINKVLQFLMPESVSNEKVAARKAELAAVLHQGGLPLSLLSNIIICINHQGYMLDDFKSNKPELNKLEKYCKIDKTATGITVTESFIYSGNISRNAPDAPCFKQSDYPRINMLEGHCSYEIVLSDETSSVVKTKFSYTTPCEELQKILKKPMIPATFLAPPQEEPAIADASKHIPQRPGSR